jgi:hypothetical protein
MKEVNIPKRSYDSSWDKDHMKEYVDTNNHLSARTTLMVQGFDKQVHPEFDKVNVDDGETPDGDVKTKWDSLDSRKDHSFDNYNGNYNG